MLTFVTDKPSMKTQLSVALLLEPESGRFPTILSSARQGHGVEREISAE